MKNLLIQEVAVGAGFIEIGVEELTPRAYPASPLKGNSSLTLFCGLYENL